VCDGSNIFPDNGFVRMSDAESNIFVKCFNENACQMGTIANPATNCAEGYNGIMCSSCTDLYWKSSGNFECYACNSPTMSRGAVFFFKVFSFYMFCYILGRVFLRGFSDSNSESLASIKILLTFIQTMTIVSKMEATRTKVEKEADMQDTMDSMLYWMNPGEWLFDFECLFVSPGFGADDSETDTEIVIDSIESINQTKYIKRLLLTIFMPLILLVANIVIIWMLTFCVKQC